MRKSIIFIAALVFVWGLSGCSETKDSVDAKQQAVQEAVEHVDDHPAAAAESASPPAEHPSPDAESEHPGGDEESEHPGAEEESEHPGGEHPG